MTGDDGQPSREVADRSPRRAALFGAGLTAAALIATLAVQGTLAPAHLLVALAALAASVLLFPERGRERPGRKLVAAGQRLAAAEALLAAIPDPVILVDRRAVVLEMNDAARDLLPALKIRHPLSFALRAPPVLDGIETVLHTGEMLRVEYAERVPTERAFEVQIGPLAQPAAGEPGERGVVLFFRDLTSARRLEHMRVDFVANASHELRTPLASLLGFIETLQGPARNDASARERFLEIMRQQALRMTRLIDDLLSLSRIELHAHVAPQDNIDLVAVVRHIVDALTPMAADRGMRVMLAGAEAPLAVRGDRDELARVAENLIENAIKYGDGGMEKVVEVEVARLQAPEGTGEAVALRVRDHGPGIAPEHLPRLTERFYRVDVASSREKGGTGLGLAIVKHIVARHRGRLTIESEIGQGAQFTVIVPAADTPVRHG